mgnify:CR=1 FL=1
MIYWFIFFGGSGSTWVLPHYYQSVEIKTGATTPFEQPNFRTVEIP